MKKVILKKRLEEGGGNAIPQSRNDEGGEKEKPTVTKNSEIEETNYDANTDDDIEMEADYQGEGVLVIDETPQETDVDETMIDETKMDQTEKGEKSKESRSMRTMFTGVPKTFKTRVTRQIVHCKQNPAKRCRSKRVGYTRAQLQAKRSGQCKKEFRQFSKALEKVDIIEGEIERDFDYIKTRNDAIIAKNTSTRGRLIIARAANLTEIGDSVEALDEENGGGKVKITMVQRIESKLYLVDQGANRTHGREVLTVYTRDELEHENDVATAPSSG